MNATLPLFKFYNISQIANSNYKEGKIRSISSKEHTYRYIPSKDLAVEIYHQKSPCYNYLRFCSLPVSFATVSVYQGLTNNHATSYKRGATQIAVPPATPSTSSSTNLNASMRSRALPAERQHTSRSTIR
jgi:hypothetical protein